MVITPTITTAITITTTLNVSNTVIRGLAMTLAIISIIRVCF